MAVTTYYGLNTTPSGGVSGNPTTARASFLAALNGTVTNYGFEDRTNGDAPPFSFTNVGASGNITTSLTADAAASAVIVNSPNAGNYATGGSNYLRTREVANALNFSFSTPIAAMGFYLTDMVEATGTVELVLTPFGGGGTTTLTIISATQSNGSLVFFGFTDPSATYTSVKLTVSSGSTNTMAIDDIVVAQAAQLISNGATLSLPKLTIAGGEFPTGYGYNSLPHLTVVGFLPPDPPKFWSLYRGGREVP